MDLSLALAPWQLVADTIVGVSQQTTLCQIFKSQVFLQAIDPSNCIIVEARMCATPNSAKSSSTERETSEDTENDATDDEDELEDLRVTLSSFALSKCLKMFGKNNLFRLLTGDIRDKVILSSRNSSGSVVYDIVINEQEAQDWIEIPAILESDLVVKVNSA
jgi:hypothetical protein